MDQNEAALADLVRRNRPPVYEENKVEERKPAGPVADINNELEKYAHTKKVSLCSLNCNCLMGLRECLRF